MTPGERVRDALGKQGFGLVEDGSDTVILTPDGRRAHRVPTSRFDQVTDRDRAGLRIIVTGLEILEGFHAPPGFWTG